MYELYIACVFVGMLAFGFRGKYWAYQYNLLLESKYPDKADDFRVPNFFTKGFVALRKLKEAKKLGDEELRKVADKCYLSYIFGSICALLWLIIIFIVI